MRTENGSLIEAIGSGDEDGEVDVWCLVRS
jgi:hypothetical protein